MIRGCWCSKSSLAKAAGAEVAVLADRWKMARRCGAKHICKSKCTKHHIRGAIFEVQMLKNGTRLWREAHLQVKMLKNWRCRSHLGSSDVEKWHAAVARSTFASENAQNTSLSEPFWKFRCSKMARAHFEVKMLKNWRVRTTFWRCDVQKCHAAVARSTFVSQNVQSTCFLHHFERFLTDSLTN